ncbi:tubulin binding cofactor C-domain-containing protein [Epithele typhae]|uniref:tubulin binding cofactor C-domain-containing protein n=1 Tax=Epithele typhae TaxID=378194 RepID=UPI002007BD29|nr:tubulin binding cofactor C-domain-containing protein [Epithele typhae]KAH9927911.1 tubulin binding cofactor C-domain-containing protein [Epithele typhae]
MSETNQELTLRYNERTQSALLALSTQLASLKDETPTQETIEKLASEISKLRRDLTDAISFLPAYDQRQYDLQLKKVEDGIEGLRASIAPKTKFAFKRKAAKPASSSPAPPLSSQPSPSPTPASATASSSGLSISGHSHRYLALSSLSSPWGSPCDLSITDLDSCIVNLLSGSAANVGAPESSQFTALHVRNLSNTVLVLPVVSGSALLHDLKNCVIVLGSRQFRMHASSAVDVYISIGSNPIIEHCSHAPSNYLAVQDFSHIRATPSPNWTVLPEDAMTQDWPLSEVGVDGALLQLLPAK